MTLLSTSERLFGDGDLATAEELARRAAVAVDNALLFDEAERRAEAARVLEHIGDGVFMLDREGVVRLWNRAAEAVTQLRAEEVVGRAAAEAIPGWSQIADRIPVSTSPSGARAAETLPFEVPERELWLSIAAVEFAEGTVYAFRDLTAERALEELRSDFVSTVSHELRTPLAAIYGAAPRGEPTERVQLEVGVHDSRDLTPAVVNAARVHLPPAVELSLSCEPGLPPVVGNPDKVRQVLTNLVDNAIKYSPDGGAVDVTGLGLYICLELVRRMNGTIWVESREGEGSLFSFELPVATG